MANKDLLQRFIFDKAPVRGEFIYLEDTFQTIIEQHAYPEPVRKVLGEALAVAGLLSAIIKFEGRLTLQFRGKGDLKLLIAQCDNQLHMRGLMKWEGELSYEDLLAAFHEGVLVIMLDPGPGKNRYQGIVGWKGNSLAESIEGYFNDSEQLATKLWLAVDDKRAAGLLLQVIPGSSKTPESEAGPLTWEDIIQLTDGFNTQDLLNLDYETLLRVLYPESSVRIFAASPVAFQCTCSHQRSEDAIALLGQEEAEAELENNHSIVVTCDFCSREYVFDQDDVAAIFAKKGKPPTDILLH